MALRSTDATTRPIRFNLPQVPTDIEPAVGRYLTELRRSVEANLQTLFMEESEHGQRIVERTIERYKIVEDTLTVAELNADQIFSEAFVMTGSGALHTSGKSSYTDNDAGIFVG